MPAASYKGAMHHVSAFYAAKMTGLWISLLKSLWKTRLSTDLHFPDIDYDYDIDIDFDIDYDIGLICQQTEHLLTNVWFAENPIRTNLPVFSGHGRSHPDSI